MAFYAVRVDADGNEVDRPKKSRGCETHRLTERSSARYLSSISASSVRYINPAVVIESSQEPDTCTSEESVSEVVPPLDLNSSGDTMPSENARFASYTIQKACEVSRITKSDAFANWLSGKKKLKSYETAKRRQIAEEQQRLVEEKKELARQKYQQWLAKKTQAKDKPPERELQEYQEYQSLEDNSEANRRAWEQSKQEELRRKKEEHLRANEQKKLLEEKRKKQSAKAWQNWLAEAPLKPKPVPLNQGFLTLKGTISDIFVNPNPWRDTCTVDECG